MEHAGSDAVSSGVADADGGLILQFSVVKATPELDDFEPLQSLAAEGLAAGFRGRGDRGVVGLEGLSPKNSHLAA